MWTQLVSLFSIRYFNFLQLFKEPRDLLRNSETLQEEAGRPLTWDWTMDMFIMWCKSLCGVSVLNWPLWWRTLNCLTFNLPDWTKAHALFSFFPHISRCVLMKMTRHNWELTYTELQPTSVDCWFNNKVVKLYCNIVLLHSIAGTHLAKMTFLCWEEAAKTRPFLWKQTSGGRF